MATVNRRHLRGVRKQYLYMRQFTPPSAAIAIDVMRCTSSTSERYVCTLKYPRIGATINLDRVFTFVTERFPSLKAGVFAVYFGKGKDTEKVTFWPRTQEKAMLRALNAR